jgi:hypothetical protein
MVHGLGDIGLHGLVEYGPCDAFFVFLFFSPFLTLYYWTIFVYFSIFIYY